MDLITQFLDSMTYDEPSDVDWRDVVEEDSDDEIGVEEKSDRALLNQYIDDIPIEKQPDFLEYIKQRVKIADPYAINNRTLLNQLWKEFTAMVGPSYPQINYGTQVNYGEVLRSAIDDVWKHLPSRYDQREHGRKKRIYSVSIGGSAGSARIDLVKKFVKRLDRYNLVIRNVQVLSTIDSDKVLGKDVLGGRKGDDITIRGSLDDVTLEMEFFHEVGHIIQEKYPSLFKNYLDYAKRIGEYDKLLFMVQEVEEYHESRYDAEVFTVAYSVAMSRRLKFRLFPGSVRFFTARNWLEQ